MKPLAINNFFHLCIFFILIVSISSSNGKTRWSALHIVPDADMFGSGEFTIGFDGYLTKDTSDNIVLKPSAPVRFGISEWINFDIGYAGGITLGLKGRILAETGKVMPSLAIGVHNLFYHKEAHYFSIDSSDHMIGEIFIAISKSVEQIKTRFHLGAQSIPRSENDLINVFAAIEKYFGRGLYTSLEFYQRDGGFNLSLYVNWRLFRNHIEISVGAVELKSMFFDKDNKFAISLAPSKPGIFVKPGIWMGFRYRGRFGLGKNRGFIAIEDRLEEHDDTVEKLVHQVDSINNQLETAMVSVNEMKNKMTTLIDSIENDPNKLKNIIFNKLISLKTLYEIEPFDAERVKLLIREITSYREKAVPSLIEILLDKKADRYVRMYSVSMLGNIGFQPSSDILLEVLAQTNDPDIKIETLIALGKMKEIRAMYLMEQLANSPNDAIAITAQEVLRRLSEETGAQLSAGLRLREIEIDENAKLSRTKTDKLRNIAGGQDSIQSVVNNLTTLKSNNIDKPADNKMISDTSADETFKEEDIASREKAMNADDSSLVNNINESPEPSTLSQDEDKTIEEPSLVAENKDTEVKAEKTEEAPEEELSRKERRRREKAEKTEEAPEEELSRKEKRRREKEEKKRKRRKDDETESEETDDRKSKREERKKKRKEEKSKDW